MAKLFEEVVGSGPLCTADIIIHFSPGGSDHPPALLATPPVASPSNGHCHGTSPIGAQTSPRPVIAMHSPVSPHRTTRSGWGHSIGNETGGQSLRCHTLLLRTQPVLLERPTAAESEKRWTTQELGLSFAPESRVSLPGLPQGYPPTSEPREPPAAAEAAAAAAWPARAFEEQVEHQVEHVEHVQDQGSVETSSARGQSEAEPMNSPRTQPTVPAHSEKPLEVMVDDEPEVFLEMIRFVYLNTCHVDQGNVKALMHIADKYCIEDIVKHCLQWMQDNFTVGLFYHLLTVQMSHEHFGRLLWNSLLKALRSRRHFALVTADAEEHLEKLPVSFVEALLRSDELPVISEIEVIHLIARWARGALARQEKRSSHEEDCERNSHEDVHEIRSHETCEEEAQDGYSDIGSTQLAAVALSDTEMALATMTETCSCGTADADEDMHKEDCKARTRGEMLRLLGAVWKSNTLVRLADMEPMFQILGLNRLFCNKVPRETSALDPGFVIYRGVAGVNTPSGVFGDHSNMVPHAWKGVSVSLGSHDFLQQQEGFKPNTVPEGGTSVFPRLWVRITCSSWSHREKRPSKSTSGHSRHSGPLGAQIPDTSSWESVPTHLMGILPVNEEPCSKFPPTLKTMQSQDDWEIGRTKTLRPPNTGCFPDLINNEKIEHKVVCAVISGQMRHGIRIGQRERSSIYDIEELYGHSEELCLGGSPTEVEFELQLKVQAPSPCGICRCSLAVLQPESATSPLEQSNDALLEVSFDASAEEHLHFYISSSYFDSNSSYTVALNWVLRPGLRLEADMDSDNDHVSPN